MILATATAPRPAYRRLAVAISAGALAAIFLGAYGALHDPGGRDTFSMIFSSMITFKVWFTSLVVLFGVVQILSALRMYGRLPFPRRKPDWLGAMHRLSGTLALLFSLPVAFHCLWSLGFNGGHGDPRALIHSVAGCVLYGAFVTKVSFVRMPRLPGAALPITGGLLFALLCCLWLTSSLWFFANNPLDTWF